MGSVTNVVLVTDLNDPGGLELSNWIREQGHRVGLITVGPHWKDAGGEKNITVDVWIGAFNYLDAAKLVAEFHCKAWRNGERTTLILAGFELNERHSAGYDCTFCAWHGF